MNLLNLTCLVLCVSFCYSTYRSWKSERNLQKYIKIVDEMLPRLLPQVFPSRAETGEVDTSGLTQGVNGGIVPEMPTFPPDYEKQLHESEVRRHLEDLTQQVLSAHTYSISYEKAWGIAETNYLAEDARQGQPLSEAVLKTLPTVGSFMDPVKANQTQAAQGTSAIQ